MLCFSCVRNIGLVRSVGCISGCGGGRWEGVVGAGEKVWWEAGEEVWEGGVGCR